MWDLKPISIYTLCSQEKSYVFSMWDKLFFKIFFKTLLFTIYKANIYMNFFLIFSYKILKL